MLSAPGVSSAGVFVNITLAPPALPVYEQPPCPQDGWLWTPGYWAYGPDGYYWVPGVWVAPPMVGLLWTPPYWGFEGGFYGFHPGYWGPHVGFYGGINYGFGYVGVGFLGGRWDGGHFAYNTAVTRVNTTIIHNTYNVTVVNNNVNRGSFNGPGGVTARPTPQEAIAAREQHVPPTGNQVSHEGAAGADRNQLANVNHGRPATMAAARPMATPARGNPALTPGGHVNNAPAPAARMNAPAPAVRPATPAPANRPAGPPAAANHPAPQAQPKPPAAKRPAAPAHEEGKEERR